MATGQPELRPRPPLATRPSPIFRQRHANAGCRAWLPLLLWLLSATSAICSSQTRTAAHTGCVRRQTGSTLTAQDPEQSASWRTDHDRSTDQERVELTSAWSRRRLLLAPDDQTAQQAAQAALNRCSSSKSLSSKHAALQSALSAGCAPHGHLGSRPRAVLHAAVKSPV